MNTQVAIIGAGPAGLVLSHLLHRRGIDSVLLEARSREYVEGRVRAGVLEHTTAQLLIDSGVGERLQREGLVHHGIELRFNGEGHRIDMAELTGGATVIVYGQQEVVRDLISARLQAGGDLRFQARCVGLYDLDGERPRVRFEQDGEEQELGCEVVAGCDGFHGVSRASVPEGVLSVFEREYPFAWLGILAEVAPSTEELIYARHERGFSLHSLRSPRLSRLYIQCDPSDDIAQWPDERIWMELHARLARGDGWALEEGPVVEKGIAPMRSFVAQPMQYGRLFLAGDAVHIVPPTGAKGLNLAVADVRVLADALRSWLHGGDDSDLRSYSSTCLRRIWRAEHFSWWMTSMLHRSPDQDPFEAQLQLAQLEYVCRSRAAATVLAENYVGLATS